MNSIEIWKDIKGYEGLYKVSNLGRVKNVVSTTRKGKGNYARPERIKAQRAMQSKKNKNVKYYGVALSKNGEVKTKLVHRLVAEAFIPNTQGKPFVNHKNGNGFDNNVNNLEWCTNSENQMHAVTVLKSFSTIKVQAKDKITGEVFIFNSLSESARWLLSTNKTKDKSCLSGVIKCSKRKIPSYLGYIWTPINE